MNRVEARCPTCGLSSMATERFAQAERDGTRKPLGWQAYCRPCGCAFPVRWLCWCGETRHDDVARDGDRFDCCERPEPYRFAGTDRTAWHPLLDGPMGGCR